MSYNSCIVLRCFFWVVLYTNIKYFSSCSLFICKDSVSNGINLILLSGITVLLPVLLFQSWSNGIIGLPQVPPLHHSMLASAFGIISKNYFRLFIYYELLTLIILMKSKHMNQENPSLQ